MPLITGPKCLRGFLETGPRTTRVPSAKGFLHGKGNVRPLGRNKTSSAFTLDCPGEGHSVKTARTGT